MICCNIKQNINHRKNGSIPVDRTLRVEIRNRKEKWARRGGVQSSTYKRIKFIFRTSIQLFVNTQSIKVKSLRIQITYSFTCA